MGKDILKKILRNQNHTSKAQKVALETLNLEDYLVVDVRSPAVFATTPHIQGAINLHDIEKLQDFCNQNQDKKILLTCNGGLEAANYGTKLVSAGFKEIYFLDEYLQIIQEYLPLENL